MQALKSLRTILAAVLFALGSAFTHAVTIPNEFWVANDNTRLNGLGNGTLDDPYNCTFTAGTYSATFDTYINGKAANSTIHILPGSYSTQGLQLKSGQKVVGSGIAETVIYILGSGTIGFWNPLAATRIEISDLTIDGNGAPSGGSSRGVALAGKQMALRRIKAINCGTLSTGTPESHILRIASDGTGDTEGNIIEDCYIDSIRGTRTVGISCAGDTTYRFAGIIRNNFINLGGRGTSDSYYPIGISPSDIRHVLFEGNTIVSAYNGVYINTGKGDFVTFMGNRFLSTAASAVKFEPSSSGYNHYNFIYNTFEIQLGGNGIYFGGAANAVDVVALGNSFTRSDTASTGNANWLTLGNLTGVTVVNNRVAPYQSASYGTCQNVNLYNNTDLNGAFLTSVNQIALPNAIKRKTIDGTVTSPYQVQNADKYLGVTVTAMTIMLPDARTVKGKEIIIVAETGSAPAIKVGTFQETGPTRQQKINGVAPANPPTANTITTAYGNVHLISDGNDWFTF